MPWKVEENGGDCSGETPWAVINEESGDTEGCHATQEEAEAQAAALYAEENGDEEESEESSERVEFEAVAVVEGVWTGDGRRFSEESLTWPDPNEVVIPVRWVERDVGGHDGAVVVGRATGLERRGHEIVATGYLDGEGEFGREALRLIRAGLIGGLSIDADDILDPAISQTEEGITLESGRIRAMTLVAIPAFVEAKLKLIDEPVVAAASGSTSLPLADEGRAWDAAGARARMKGDSETPDSTYRAGHFFVDGTGENFGDYKLPFADVIDGKLTAVPRGVFAAASAIQGGRGGTSIPDAQLNSVRAKIGAYYKKLDRDPPWTAAAAAVAAMRSSHGWLSGIVGPESTVEPIFRESFTSTTFVDLAAPPRSHFDDPKLDGPSPLRVDDDGRVTGHVALWETCHVDYPNCRTAPRSPSGYAFFMTGCTRCDDGSEVATGPLTLTGGHEKDRWAPAAKAIAHYDDSNSAVADLVVGEDAFGIWCSGSLRPGVNDAQVRALLGSSPSGDWRPIRGSLELIAVLMVNAPGFPVRRAAVHDERMVSLVASTGLTADGGGACSCSSRIAALEARLAAVEPVARALTEEAISALAARLRVSSP